MDRDDDCGEGGWTLAMKIDGSKVKYDLPFVDSLTNRVVLVYCEKWPALHMEMKARVEQVR